MPAPVGRIPGGGANDSPGGNAPIRMSLCTLPCVCTTTTIIIIIECLIQMGLIGWLVEWA
jgi:hypothetical protein